MASFLISKLNANVGKTPDEIVKAISDPFSFWAQGDIVTRELIETHGETPIVICHRDYRNDPNGECEDNHRLSSNRYGYHNWSLEVWNTGVLRAGGSYWFRSRASYEANPSEGW